MYNSALHEIVTTREWDLTPDALHGYKAALDRNISERMGYVKPEERSDRPYVLSSKSDFSERLYAGNADRIDYSELEPEDRIINVIRVEGAILRNGGACAYGSKEHRDIIKRAADQKQTIGHYIYINSGGGSSYAKYDYEDAFNYARSKGQPIVGLIDGMAGSAAYALGAMCDKLYFVGSHDLAGCIGTMAAYYANKDGDVNAVTQERYIEVYATASPYKNRESRDAAEGNYELLQKDVDSLCEDFHSMVRKYRPSVTDEQLKGKIYPASEVIGTMVDGQADERFCIEEIIRLYNERHAVQSASPISGANRQESTTKNQTEMKEYPKMTAALGLEALVSDQSNGVYLNEELADAAEQAFANAEHLQGTLDAKMEEVKQLNESIANLKKEHEAAMAAATEAHQQAIDDLKSAHQTAMEESDKAHQDEVTALSNQLGEAQQALEAKETEIQELSEAAGSAPATAEVPEDNTVQGKQEAKMKVYAGEGMTLAEKYEAIMAHTKENERRAYK